MTLRRSIFDSASAPTNRRPAACPRDLFAFRSIGSKCAHKYCLNKGELLKNYYTPLAHRHDNCNIRSICMRQTKDESKTFYDLIKEFKSYSSKFEGNLDFRGKEFAQYLENWFDHFKLHYRNVLQQIADLNFEEGNEEQIKTLIISIQALYNEMAIIKEHIKSQIRYYDNPDYLQTGRRNFPAFVTRMQKIEPELNKLLEDPRIEAIQNLGKLGEKYLFSQESLQNITNTQDLDEKKLALEESKKKLEKELRREEILFPVLFTLCFLTLGLLSPVFILLPSSYEINAKIKQNTKDIDKLVEIKKYMDNDELQNVAELSRSLKDDLKSHASEAKNILDQDMTKKNIKKPRA